MKLIDEILRKMGIYKMHIHQDKKTGEYTYTYSHGVFGSINSIVKK
jgi:hypothetical protein